MCSLLSLACERQGSGSQDPGLSDASSQRQSSQPGSPQEQTDPLVREALDEMFYTVRGRGWAVLTAPELRIVERRGHGNTLCEEILRADPVQDSYYVTRLFFILGITKDIASADCLREYWSQHELGGLSAWLAGWHHQLAYFAAHESEWAAIRAQWEEVFEWLLEQDIAPDVRAMTLTVVGTWFYDERTTNLLRTLRDASEVSDEETVILNWALQRRGVPAQKQNLQESFAALARRDPRTALYYAWRMPSADVLPVLAQLSEVPAWTDDADRALRRITFTDSLPSGSWAEWYWHHNQEDRTIWRRNRTEELKGLLAANQTTRVVTFLREWCVPGDPEAIELAVQLIHHQDVQEHVANLLRPSLDPAIRRLNATALSVLVPTSKKDATLRAILTRHQMLPTEWKESVKTIGLSGVP